MGIFHFLNVKNGDCSIIQHPSGHITVVDVCNAYKEDTITAMIEKTLVESERQRGNLDQKKYPVNPITYLKGFDISSVFRFVLTHPDMDHIGGIEDFFNEFAPVNFWDTANHPEKDFTEGSPYSESDWLFYKSLRDGNPQDDPKRLVLYAGADGQYYNRSTDGSGGGDGLYILGPTPELMRQAVECDDYNDASYVILYRSLGGRILFAGDSHDATWEHILAHHSDDVKDVDLLIAPHHGRASGRSYKFLDVVNPAVTFFGNANSEHLAYDAWNYRDLYYITNNQANCMIVNANTSPMELFITNDKYARQENPHTWYSTDFRAWYLGQFPTR